MLISVPTEDAYLVFSCLNAPLSFSAGISVIVCAVVFYVTDNNMVLAWPCVTICQWPRAVLRAGPFSAQGNGLIYTNSSRIGLLRHIKGLLMTSG